MRNRYCDLFKVMRKIEHVFEIPQLRGKLYLFLAKLYFRNNTIKFMLDADGN